MLLLAACQDAPVGPRSPDAGGVGMPEFRVTAQYAPDRQSANIRVTRTGGTFVLGQHLVVFPRNSICALGSSYGPTEWDKPCTPAKTAVNFHVEITRDDNGRSYLSFWPAVRFVPSEQVMLYMWAGPSDPVDNQTPQILWSPYPGAPAIDESLTDPTLITRVWPGTSIVYRRIKHFSTYMVGSGFSADDEHLDDGQGGEGEGETQVP